MATTRARGTDRTAGAARRRGARANQRGADQGGPRQGGQRQRAEGPGSSGPGSIGSGGAGWAGDGWSGDGWTGGEWNGTDWTGVASDPLEAEAGVAAFLDALDAGAQWYTALLEIVSRWVTPDEVVDGVVQRYLIGGEAFDWALLAQRLVDAAGSRIPTEQAERMLFFNEPPRGETEEDFARAIGAPKYRAHLNFQYGVVVEEVLLLAAEEELHKARRIDGIRGLPADVEAYERVYGVPLEELRVHYRSETGQGLGEQAHRAEIQAFTYWCSQFRVRLGEPARVASDTRKAMSLLSRMHAQSARRRERQRDAEIVIDLG